MHGFESRTRCQLFEGRSTERLETERRERDEKERLQAEQREKEETQQLEVKRREREEKERGPAQAASYSAPGSARRSSTQDRQSEGGF